MITEATLPLPPSVNDSDTFTKRARFAARKRKADYASAVLSEMRSEFGVGGYPTYTGPVEIVIVFHFKDGRLNDIDNRVKPLLDALTFAKVWKDDFLVWDLRVIRGYVVKPDGCVAIHIQPLGVQ